MVALPRRVFECGGDIAFLQQRIVCKDLGAVSTGSQQVQHVPDPNTQTAQAGPAAALAKDRR